MSAIGKRQALVQLRRMLRRLDRSHSGEESGCPTCSLQRMAAQLVDEIEAEAQQLASPDLGPGAASVTLAVEALIAVVWALDVRAADEQGRVLQALLDHIGDVVLDQLAQEELNTTGTPAPEDDDAEPEPAPPRRSGSLH